MFMYDYAITLTKVHSRRLGSICTASLLSRRPYRWHCSQLQASFISCNMRCLHTCPPCHVNCSHVKVNSNRWTVRPTHLWHATQHCSCRRNVVASQSGHQGSAQEEVLQIQPGTKPRGQFKLAGSPFTFKGAMIYLGGRLFNCELGSTVGPGDQELLNGLLEFHHDATSKKGAGVSHFTVNQSPHGETRCFWIHRVDGSSEDFSYIRCLRAWTYMAKFGLVDDEGFPTCQPPKMENVGKQWKPSTVTWDKTLGQWKAQMWMNGTQNNLGLFDHEEDAVSAYNSAVRQAMAEGSFNAQQLPVQQQSQLGDMIQSWQSEMHSNLADGTDMFHVALHPSGSYDLPPNDSYSMQPGSSLSSYDLPIQDAYSSFDSPAQATSMNRTSQTGRPGRAAKFAEREDRFGQSQASSQLRGYGAQRQLQGDHTQWQPSLMAMRNAVVPTLKRFRNDAFQQHLPPPICSLTGQQLTSPESATVNYAPPQTFKKLAVAWLELVGVSQPDQLLLQQTNDRLQWIMANEGHSTSWITYHDMHAQLQLISKSARQST